MLNPKVELLSQEEAIARLNTSLGIMPRLTTPVIDELVVAQALRRAAHISGTDHALLA